MRLALLVLVGSCLVGMPVLGQQILPDPNLTPGAQNEEVTQQTIGSTICVRGYTKTIRPPAKYTTALKRRQIREYGFDDTKMSDYEEDHLISLELGGHPTDPGNLWPQSYLTQPWNAKAKDQLENFLNAEVCAGRIPLARAQREIASDWVAAYKKYLGEP